MNVRAVVIDDEPAARRGVQLLAATDPDLQLVGEAADARSGLELCRELKPDLVFLDVQMPHGTGFDVVAGLPSEASPAVIFVTAYDEYALKAFEVSAADYLLKPFEDSRFRAAVAKAKGDLRLRRLERGLDARLEQIAQHVQTPAAVPESDRILIKSAGEIFFLKPADVDWIEAEGDYMQVHAGGKTYPVRETMAKLSARLDSRRFIRIHRSTLVNIDRVSRIRPAQGGDYTVVLADGTELKLSRGHHESLATLLGRNST